MGNDNPAPRYLTQKDLMQRLRCKRTKLHTLRKSPEFPSPFYLALNSRPLWVEDDIKDFENARRTLNGAQQSNNPSPDDILRTLGRAPRDTLIAEEHGPLSPRPFANTGPGNQPAVTL